MDSSVATSSLSISMASSFFFVSSTAERREDALADDPRDDVVDTLRATKTAPFSAHGSSFATPGP